MSLGNDIVDLSLTKLSTNWQRIGWIDKVCTPNEQQYVADSQNPFLMIWRIWSMKESAYKISIQNGSSHALNPQSYDTNIIDQRVGKVTYEGNEYMTHSSITDKRIASYTTSYGEENIIHRSFSMSSITPNQRSGKLKEMLLAHVASVYLYPKNALHIIKNEDRVPVIYQDGRALDIPISISHHGVYGAYVFSNNKIAS